jgi:hypothetical protein
MRYKLVKALETKIEEVVNKLILEGWEPIGGLHVRQYYSTSAGSANEVFQPMINNTLPPIEEKSEDLPLAPIGWTLAVNTKPMAVVFDPAAKIKPKTA